MTARTTFTATGLAALALVFPTGAAAHIDTAVSSVQAHTDKADSALHRAVSLFDANRDRRAQNALTRSRRQVGKANREAAKLRRQADRRREHAQAQRALRIVASQRDSNIETLLGALDEASGKVENKVAKAALTDTRGRDKAIAVLQALLDEPLPAQAEDGIMKAMASLAQDRGGELEAAGEALASDEVSPKSKRKVVRAVEHSVDGQATAAARITELLESEDMPEQSKFGLDRALKAIIAEQEAVAETLQEFSDQMPPRIREFVEQIVELAQENAQSLRDERPDPPAADPEDPPAGSEDPPAGSEDAPSGSEENPSGSEEPPAGADDTPGGSQVPEEPGSQAPAGGTA